MQHPAATHIAEIIRVQSIFRAWFARKAAVIEIKRRWEKIYDPKRQRHYYFDTVNACSQWRKPKLLRNDDIEHISALYSREQAAVVIQRQIRRRQAHLLVVRMYVKVVQVLFDDQSGYEYWYNPSTGFTAWSPPNFLANQVRIVTRFTIP